MWIYLGLNPTQFSFWFNVFKVAGEEAANVRVQKNHQMQHQHRQLQLLLRSRQPPTAKAARNSTAI